MKKSFKADYNSIHLRLTKKQAYITGILSGLSMLIALLSLLFSIYFKEKDDTEDLIINVKIDNSAKINISHYKKENDVKSHYYLSCTYNAQVINNSKNTITLVSFNIMDDSISNLNRDGNLKYQFKEPLIIEPKLFANFVFKNNIPIDDKLFEKYYGNDFRKIAKLDSLSLSEFRRPFIYESDLDIFGNQVKSYYFDNNKEPSFFLLLQTTNKNIFSKHVYWNETQEAPYEYRPN